LSADLSSLKVATVVDDRPHFSPDEEEARLLAILATCHDKVTAARQALADPAHSMLTPEYTKLQDDHEMARVEWAKAAAELREHRERRGGQAGENSK
jgi:hypothetical protein